MNKIKFISTEITDIQKHLLERQEQAKKDIFSAFGIDHKTMQDLPKYGKSPLESFIKNLKK